MPGKVDRAFSVDRVPSGRIGAAEILDLQTDADDGLLAGQVGDPLGRLPGGATRRPANNGDLFDSVVFAGGLKLRRTELIPVPSQAVLPGKPASGGRGQRPFHFGLFPGCHQRDAVTAAQQCQIVG